MMYLKPPARVAGAQHSSFCGLVATPLRAPSLGCRVPGRNLGLQVQSLRQCQLTGKKANNGYLVSFSHRRTKSLQHVNLFSKRVFWPERQRWIRLRLSAKALKTVEKKGLQNMAKDIGLDLEKLPYEDVRKARTEWLAEQPNHPPQPSKINNSRRMKNPEKLKASKKKPNLARYFMGGRIVVSRDPTYIEDYKK